MVYSIITSNRNRLKVQVKRRWSIKTTGGGVKKGSYNFPFFRMAIRSQTPMRAAARNPIIPIREMPKKIGGVILSLTS